MSHASIVQVPLLKRNFCGERAPDNHGAPREKSVGPRRARAARGSQRDRNSAQPAENLGSAWVASRAGATAIAAARSPISFQRRTAVSPSSVDTPKLFTYRGTRLSCTAAMKAVKPREQVGPQVKSENTLLRIQPSVVNPGGTAVA
jgi:hypothetical protein